MAESEKDALEVEEFENEEEFSEDSLIDPIYKKYVRSVIRSLGSTEFYQFFMDALACSKNEIQFSNRRVEKIVDIKWVEAMEDALNGFQTIVSSPRNIIREEELIVNVANAKKAGSDVVQHLAMHASLVEDFNEKTGDVRPGKLMQKYREDSISRLYENRVAFTALESAQRFVSIRYDALTQVMNEEFGAKLKVNTEMLTATEAVHMDTYIHINDVDSAMDTDDKNREVFDRVARLNRILTSHMNTHFARHMAKYARVKGQITKTNILKKDPNYRAVAKLWDFLREYEKVGYVINIEEQNPVIDENFQRDIYHNIFFNYLVLKGHLEKDKDRKLPEPLKRKKKAIKPKFIKQIIEEITEDYDLPEIEIRKVLIEHLTKEQLMLEEEAERHRLVEEQEQREREEAERIRREQEAEEERLRLEREAEEERIRLEKEAEEARLEKIRLEKEIEEHRRRALFEKELDRFESLLEERLNERKEQEKIDEENLSDFEDAASILEETERLKEEEAERERQRAKEEAERKELEERMAKEKARREEEERRAAALREEERRLLEEARILREKEEQARKEQYEKDVQSSKKYVEHLNYAEKKIPERLKLRRAYIEEQRSMREAFELERQKRAADRSLAGK